MPLQLVMPYNLDLQIADIISLILDHYTYVEANDIFLPPEWRSEYLNDQLEQLSIDKLREIECIINYHIVLWLLTHGFVSFEDSVRVSENQEYVKHIPTSK